MTLFTRHFKGPIARGTVRTRVVLGLRLVVQAGTLLIVGRRLGPGAFGVFAGVAALAVLLGTLSTFGMHLVLLGEVSKDPARRGEVLPYAIPASLLCGSLLLGIYCSICRGWLYVRCMSVVALRFGFAVRHPRTRAVRQPAAGHLLGNLPLVARCAKHCHWNAAAHRGGRDPAAAAIFTYGQRASRPGARGALTAAEHTAVLLALGRCWPDLRP